MKKKLIVVVAILIIFLTFESCAKTNQLKSNEKQNVFYVASWNLENLFDAIDDPDKNDEWYLPSSEIEWNNDKLNLKLENLAKVISYMNDGNGPDILGVQEVEHKSLLNQLVNKIDLKKNYKILYEESPDFRGIDNALIYNSDLFTVESYEGINVELEGDKKTRLIFYAVLKMQNNKFHVFVNHWPSRRGGLKKSEKHRIKAAETLINRITKINDLEKSNIIIVGDFNDLPSNISVKDILNAKEQNCDSDIINKFSLINLSFDQFKNGNGTYKYKDHWNMLDQIIISNSFFNKKNVDYICGSFEIIKPKFVIQKEGKYKGTSLPTYGGRKYLNGFSDHFSIGAKFMYIAK